MRERLECGPYDARNAFLAVEGGRPVVLENLDCDRGCNPLLEIKQGLGPNLGGDNILTFRHRLSVLHKFCDFFPCFQTLRVSRFEKKLRLADTKECEKFSFTRVTCENKTYDLPISENAKNSVLRESPAKRNKLRLADTTQCEKSRVSSVDIRKSL